MLADLLPSRLRLLPRPGSDALGRRARRWFNPVVCADRLDTLAFEREARCPTRRARLPGRSFCAGLQDASCCPSLGPEHKRRRWQRLAAPFAELCLSPCIQSSRVAAGRAHAKGERLPPIVKARMLDPDC